MSTLNASARELLLKIVYYGPGMSGKTTSLQYIHSAIPDDSRPEMVSIATEEDRTLFFDFLPVTVARLGEFAVRLLMFTVPGQVVYQSTRKLVLNGADGVVFVADSQPDQRDANAVAYRDLKENLFHWGAALGDFPHVFQFNKRELPGVMPVDTMRGDLIEYGAPYFETVATEGTGVHDAMQAITRLVVKRLKEERDFKTVSGPPMRSGRDTMPGSIADSIARTLPNRPSAAPTTPAPAPPTSLSFLACWRDPVCRAEAGAIETMIAGGNYVEALIKCAQLLELLAHRNHHPRNQEASFVLLYGINGAEYLDFKRRVTGAVRGDGASEESALAGYLLLTRIALIS